MRASLPIYYINLDNRPERRDFMEAQFARLGLSATRVSAVTPHGPRPDALAPHVDPRAGHWLTPLVEACGLSHLLCWTMLLAAPGRPDWALVLEDDGVLSTSLPAFLEAFGAQAEGTDADIVQLEVQLLHRARILPARYTLASGHRLARFRSTPYGSGAYLISRRAAESLLGRRDLFHQPIDIAMFRPFIGPGRSLRSYLSDPGLCIQLEVAGSASEASRSDVSQDRFAAMMPGRRFLRRQVVGSLNFIDHLVHLPRGLANKMIPFDGDPTTHD
ncbi:MAG TPA: glycosyltransferase family 25 protein [Devosia sp.]|nr:glycosyltransferase family 25 protein [Devosia sp.]